MRQQETPGKDVRKPAQRTNVTHPTRDARVGTPVIARRFIGGIRIANQSQSVKRTAETSLRSRRQHKASGGAKGNPRNHSQNELMSLRSGRQILRESVAR